MRFLNTRSIHYGILAVSSVISAIATTTYAGVALIQYRDVQRQHVIAEDNISVSSSVGQLPDNIIDLTKAVSIAETYKSGKVLEAVLSQKQGKLFYLVDLNDHGKISVVWVDALNGEIRDI